MAARTILTQRTASAVWRTRAAALLQFQGTRCRTRNLRDEPKKIARSLHPHRRCRNRICRRWNYAPKRNSRWAVTLGTDARGTPRRIWRARSAPGLGPSPRIYSEFLKRERGRNSEKASGRTERRKRSWLIWTRGMWRKSRPTALRPGSTREGAR